MADKLGSSLTVTIKCPECGHEIEKALLELKSDPAVKCPACLKLFALDVQGDSPSGALSDIDKLLSDFVGKPTGKTGR